MFLSCAKHLPQNVPGVQGVEAQAVPYRNCGVKVNDCDPLHTIFKILFSIKDILVFGISHFQKTQVITEQQPQDGFGRVRHVDFRLFWKVCLLRQIRK